MRSATRSGPRSPGCCWPAGRIASRSGRIASVTSAPIAPVAGTTPSPSASAPSAPDPRRDQVRPADEIGDKAVGRGLIDFLRAAQLLHAPALHHRNAVRHRQSLVLIMGDKDKGDAGFALQRLQFRPHPLAQLGVQRRQGFVQQQDLRPRRQRARQGHPLLLPARKLIGAAMLHPFQPDQFHHPGHGRGDLGLGTPQHPQGKADVLRHGQMRKQGVMLKHRIDRAILGRQTRDIAPEDGNLARRSAGRTRQSAAEAWSCRSPRGQAA